MQGQRGFTLFELMITLAIAAVVISLAAPSFSNMIQDNRLSGQSLDFLAALNFARSEAIKRKRPVTLCKSGNGTDCAGAGDWGQGWIVFVDTDGNRTRNPDPNGDEILLRVHDALAGNNTLTGNNNFTDAISYLPSGDTDGLGNGTLILCDSRKDDTRSPAIVINSTGRARVTTVDQTGESCA